MSSDLFKNKQKVFLTPRPTSNPQATGTANSKQQGAPPGNVQNAKRGKNPAGPLGSRNQQVASGSAVSTMDAGLLAQAKIIFSKLETERQDRIIAVLKRSGFPEDEKFNTVAAFTSQLAGYKARGDLVLQEGTTNRVTIEGIPALMNAAECTELVRKICQNTEPTKAIEVRMLKPLPAKGGEKSRTTQCIIDELYITSTSELS